MFYIQASNPQNNGNFDEDDCKLMEAAETVFPMETEAAIMVWNYIYIPLSYKYDISYMIGDMIELIKEVANKKEGVKKLHWLPDTFASLWEVRWKEDTIEVNTTWSCVIGEIVNSLNRNSQITMNKWDFINEWKAVLCNVKDALLDCGYNETNLEDMYKIQEVLSLFTGDGRLYQNK